jgi:hypothetical protein
MRSPAADAEGTTVSAARRRYIKLDVYALDDLTKTHLLKPHHRDVLLTLTRWAHWETWEWTGTLRDLSEATGMARKTVPDTLDHLVDEELVGVVKPFARSQQGTLAVVAYDRLVVPETRRSRREQIHSSRWATGPTAQLRVENTPTSRRLCSDNASIDSKSPPPANGSGPSRGARREERGAECVAHGIESCLDCPPGDELAQKISGALPSVLCDECGEPSVVAGLCARCAERPF